MNRSFPVFAVDTVRSIKPMNIRHTLIAAFVTLTTALAGAGGAHAAAPLFKAAPVGFYRMMLADYEVTALLDGALAVPFPGIGHLCKEGQGYVFVPANFAPAR